MGIIGTIFIGLIVGLLARFLKPGDDSMGWIMTILLGIAGSLAATYGGQALGIYQAGQGAGFIGALVGAISWNIITWYYGIPSSSSHALIGGIVGAVIAKAGASALGTQVQDTAGAYREKMVGQGEALIEEAKAAAVQAKDKAAALAQEGKARAVDGIATASKLVAENAPVIDEKLGAKYGDYARSAAKALDETAAKLEAKDLGELGDDAREFVRKSPALAVGIAAAFGFFVSRLFRGSPKSDD